MRLKQYEIQEVNRYIWIIDFSLRKEKKNKIQKKKSSKRVENVRNSFLKLLSFFKFLFREYDFFLVDRGVAWDNGTRVSIQFAYVRMLNPPSHILYIIFFIRHIFPWPVTFFTSFFFFLLKCFSSFGNTIQFRFCSCHSVQSSHSKVLKKDDVDDDEKKKVEFGITNHTWIVEKKRKKKITNVFI